MNCTVCTPLSEDRELPVALPQNTTHKMPGHWLLAKMGKRVLRPGGLELTRAMLDRLAVGPHDDPGGRRVVGDDIAETYRLHGIPHDLDEPPLPARRRPGPSQAALPCGSGRD